MRKRVWFTAVGALGAIASLLVAACSKDARLGPLLPPCTASGDSINLAVSAYVAADPGSSSGCVVFPANPSASAIAYLLVPQGTNGVPDDWSSFLLRGATLPVAAPPTPVLAALSSAAAPGVQQQFDGTLRRAERALALRSGPLAPPTLAAPVPAVPPTPGTSRTFKVCKVLTCDPTKPSTLVSVTATAKTVGQHVAIYADNVATGAGDTLSTADLTALAAVFDTLLYPRDTAAFGRESDIDGNGVVIVLMTGRVNALVSDSVCMSSGFVAGYFFGADLITAGQYSTGNNGEIFYSMVPDPTGALSCRHSASDVKHAVPGTFIHEFQHMISFNQHFLKHNGIAPPEDLWLNEGLSHYAEEMGARLYMPDTTFCYFIFGDLYNAHAYLARPDTSFLVDTAGIGGLSDRGAYWLFVRFVVDQVATDTSFTQNDVVTRALEQTTLTGAANVANVTGSDFATVVEHWALANYVSDTTLSAVTAPPELQYKKWRFRTDFTAIHNACAGVSSSFPVGYPLVPATGLGSATNLSGKLRSGSGTYYIAQQAAGDPGFTLLFSDGSGRALRPSLGARLNVIRIQ
jgi:hypothetical protein